MKESGCFFCGFKHFRHTVQKSRWWFVLASCLVSQRSCHPEGPVHRRHSSVLTLVWLMVRSISRPHRLQWLLKLHWGILRFAIILNRNLYFIDGFKGGITTPCSYSQESLTDIRIGRIRAYFIWNDDRRNLLKWWKQEWKGGDRCWQ